jgi:hypothetical protein
MDAVEEAFNQTDCYDVILALADVVRETAMTHQLHFDDLKHGQQVALHLEMFGVEMGDGGFYQLLTQPAGDYVPQIMQTCKMIGAVDTALLLQKAIALFPSVNILRHTEARQNWIESSGQALKEALAALDEDYFAQEEEVFDLGMAYLKGYKADFRSLEHT